MLIQDIDTTGNKVSNDITLLYKYLPRSCQLPLWQAMVPEIFTSEKDQILGLQRQQAKRAVLM